MESCTKLLALKECIYLTSLKALKESFKGMYLSNKSDLETSEDRILICLSALYLALIFILMPIGVRKMRLTRSVA